MKIEIERMADKFVFGFNIFKNFVIINIPHYEIWIMSDEIYNELKRYLLREHIGTIYRKEVE